MSSSLVFATVVEVFQLNNPASNEATGTDWMVEYQYTTFRGGPFIICRLNRDCNHLNDAIDIRFSFDSF